VDETGVFKESPKVQKIKSTLLDFVREKRRKKKEKSRAP